MSKLSQPLKALINAAQSKPGTTPAPQRIISVYETIVKEAARHGVGAPAWLCASVWHPDMIWIVLMTMTDSSHHNDELSRIIAPSSEIGELD